MAFNNGFPMGYQSIQMETQPQQTNTGIIWVQGEAGAKSYLVAPNSSVTLWDSESQTIYVKSADASGMPNMKVLDYTIREQNNATRADSDFKRFATKDDISLLEKQINGLKQQIKASKEVLSDE